MSQKNAQKIKLAGWLSFADVRRINKYVEDSIIDQAPDELQAQMNLRSMKIVKVLRRNEQNRQFTL